MKKDYIILKCNNPRIKAGMLPAIWKFYLEILPEYFANMEMEKRKCTAKE